MISFVDSLIPVRVQAALEQEESYTKLCVREEKARTRRYAEHLRKQTHDRVAAMAADATPEARIAAAKARAREVHAKIEDINAAADLEALRTSSPAAPAALTGTRIDDLDGQFGIHEQLTGLFLERIKTAYAKVNWTNTDGSPNYFNKAVHKNSIPLDRHLAIIANMTDIPDDFDLKLHSQVDAILECGLYPRVKKGKLTYGYRCQDTEHCNFCNYINDTDGVKLLQFAYSPRAFAKGGHWLAITVTPRTSKSAARAIGTVIKPVDWEYDNEDSIVYRESRRGRVFQYLDPEWDCGDWEIQSTIRQFLGAAQYTFGKLVKNDWLDGIRARAENSISFLPYTDHWHWHAVGNSLVEHDPQRMADFIKAEIDALLVKAGCHLYADVVVAVIPTAADLRRWVKYCNKTIDLVGAVASVYNGYPGLRRMDAVHKKFMLELRHYLNRNRCLSKCKRLFVEDEKGKHTYCLRRRFVLGNHKFGKGSILSETKRHREWRKKHKKSEKNRARRRKADRPEDGDGMTGTNDLKPQKKNISTTATNNNFMPLKPVTIPIEILTISDATLSERLMLALYAADPMVAAFRVRRALGISKAGLRQLKRRLMQEGLLAQSGNRTLLLVPGLVYEEHPEGGGHFVAIKKGIEIEQKVAPLPLTKASDAVSAIVIPAEIINLSGVSASEKFALSVYADNPTATNARVLEILATSLAGLKKIKRRLIDAGLLTTTATDYRVHVPGLVHVDGPEGGHFMPETEAIKTGKIVAPFVVRKVRSCEAIWNEWQALIKKFCEDGSPAIVFAGITENFIKSVEEEALESPERKAILSIMKNKANYYTCLQYVRNYCPKQLQDDYVKMLKTFDSSMPEKLTVLRETVESVLVAGGDPHNMIEFAGGARQLPEGNPCLQLMNAKVAPPLGGCLQS